ncbi:AsmA-like C-terminal region-containing protein [Roseovarius aestuariivivens]|uniref:AsmA-like C-terminal region-containing protein n=1 Tax=Roseovarius aestuariivivens TaxID=1888910 RepID=UPI001436C194|nr:AsmA-like C-terminal region-containing protein [Roseovarius aestuariivivens]
MTGALALALLVSLGTRISAPDWLRGEITQRINNQLGGVNLAFGDVAMVVEDGFVPRLMLRDVTIRGEGGADLANLSDVQSAVALRPLLRGELRPNFVRLSGAQVVLRRNKEGAIGLSVGTGMQPVREAANIAGLIEQVDTLLQRPAFAALDRIEADNLNVRYEDARADRAWTVDGGRVALNRDGRDLNVRGDFALLGERAYATTLEMNYSSLIGETEAEVGISFEDMPARDIAGQSPALAWLTALDAPISGALRAGVDSDGRLGPLNATLQIGAGAIRPNAATKPIAFESVQSYFTYDPDDQVIVFNELSVDSKWVSTRAEARAYLVGVENGGPREILLQATLGDIRANPAGLYAAPVTLDSALMDLKLQLDPFIISLGQLSLRDQGEVLVAHGEARAEPGGWELGVDARMGRITPERLLALWPETVKDKTRSWLVENVRTADLQDIQFALRARPEAAPDYFLGFDFANFSTRFIKTLPVIEAAHGHATLDENRFVVSALGGHVTAPQGGQIDISGTSFQIPDVRIKQTPAHVELRTESTVTAALSLLDEPPFRFMQKAGQAVALAQGRARLKGTLDFLLLEKLTTDQVAFDVGGTLSDVRSDVLVPGRVLSAPDLAVRADSETLTVSGAGLLGGVPFNATFESGLAEVPGGGQSVVTGWVELSDRFAEEFRLGLPAGSLSGQGQAEIEITLAKGQPGDFELSSDLAGVGLSLPQLGWALARGATGRLEVLGRLGEPPSIDRLVVEGPGLEARGNVSLQADGQLDRASFTRVRVGDWIDAPVELVGRGDRPPAVRVLGGVIDLRETSLAGGAEGGSGARADRGPVSIVLDRLQVSEGIALTDFRAELELAGGARGDFSGRINGYTPIAGRVTPQGGRSAFRIQSDDAGGVLGSAGLMRQARNGRLDLTLLPGQAPGTYEGRLQMRGGMRIKNAPSMAALLNAISVVGLLEQLGGEGIHFEQVDARFQLSPQRVTLYSGSATGASMGISMDGYYYLDSKRMDMQGVISPIYMVNAVGGLFTRRGEGLFGFNYTLKGPANDPQVSVNPLSALTPGMFREIFRRAPPRQQPPLGTTGEETGVSSENGREQGPRVRSFDNRQTGR